MFKHIGMQSFGEIEKLLQLNRVKFFNFVKNEKILDYGGGDGNVWSVAGKQNLLKIDLLEPDEDLVKIAKSRDIYENIYSSDLDIEKSQYSSLTCFNVLEHIEEPKRFLKNFLGYKKIHIVVPNAESFHRQVGLQMGLIENIYELSENDLKVGHKRYYDKETLLSELEILTKKGYSIKKYGTISFKFLDNKSTASFKDLFNDMNKVAEKNKLIGENRFNGAELGVTLEKLN